jgi:exodeoxyribonuclease (lambda-induced)
MKIYDMEQGSDAWHEVRKLKFTASNATTIMAMGQGVKTLIKQMLAEYYSSANYPDYTAKFENVHIRRGHEFEDKARQVYALETGYNVETVGFVETDDYEGCSPDGLVNDDGLLEIKNLSDNAFLELMLTDKIEKKHLDQMQMQLYETGRRWCDYFAFNPNFEPCYYSKRIYPDIEVFEKLTEGLKYAKSLLLQQKEKLDKLLKAA